MMNVNHKTLFTGLAFLAVMINSPERPPGDKSAKKIRKLADLMEAFSVEHSGTWMDALIERHVAELRDNEETELPDDRQTLMDMHDRLQHRKARRLCREFYASATEAKLADRVLGLMDEELEDEAKSALA